MVIELSYYSLLTYEIEAEDVYQDFWHDKDKFDNSELPRKLPILR